MTAPRVLGIFGSLSSPSRSSALVQHVLDLLQAEGATTKVVDLTALPADALLARRRDPALDDALAEVGRADALVLGTPIYRASYTGQLKAFFDLLPQDALLGRVVGFIATGAGPAHALAVDHGLRPLVASLRGLSASQSLYATDAALETFPQGPLPDPIAQQLRLLAAELLSLAARLDTSPDGARSE
jgi:FMN reductase